jgi:hypothetical protein
MSETTWRPTHDRVMVATQHGCSPAGIFHHGGVLLVAMLPVKSLSRAWWWLDRQVWRGYFRTIWVFESRLILCVYSVSLSPWVFFQRPREQCTLALLYVRCGTIPHVCCLLEGVTRNQVVGDQH